MRRDCDGAGCATRFETFLSTIHILTSEASAVVDSTYVGSPPRECDRAAIASWELMDGLDWILCKSFDRFRAFTATSFAHEFSLSRQLNLQTSPVDNRCLTSASSLEIRRQRSSGNQRRRSSSPTTRRPQPLRTRRTDAATAILQRQPSTSS